MEPSGGGLGRCVKTPPQGFELASQWILGKVWTALGNLLPSLPKVFKSSPPAFSQTIRKLAPPPSSPLQKPLARDPK